MDTLVVKKASWLGLFLVMSLPLDGAWATGPRKPEEITLLNRQLKGKIVDYTDNHDKDRRIWSSSLDQKRDMYVYLPPQFDPHQRYPLVIYMHGFAMDEHMFLECAPFLDDAIARGKLPPVIVAVPDGSLNGEANLLSPGSFFLNSDAGEFEDFIIQDVWDFMVQHYPIRPERQAHVLAGFSMGGFGAFNLGIRHRDGFGVVIGIFPPLNLRWISKKGDYFANFDPYDWAWRTELKGHQPIARFLGGLVTMRVKHMIDPLFASRDEAMQEISKQNPIELVDRTCLRNGELAMYVAYAGQDEFNIDAQVESFLYLAAYRRLGIGVGYDPKGHHNMMTACKLFPGIVKWLAPLLAPYSPPLDGACCYGLGSPPDVPCLSGLCLPGKEARPPNQCLYKNCPGLP